ncbi:LURP-one-related/scramblase family protein [Lacrimispora sp.]|uniref:LURP-one-related/scramblase family protein n=1 Tax=Lacrimispora sp. TaxID=2719234 RepID=UPI002FD8B295
MRLMFKQRFFSWFDSYDIYDENGDTVYTVKGKLDWGHRLEVYDQAGRYMATLKEKVLTFLPRFFIQVDGQTVGTITKELTFFKPSFSIDCNGWRVEGSLFEWDYRILSGEGRVVARIEKKLFNWTDTYSIDVEDPQDSLMALMVVLAIDAVKCSQRKG